MGESRGRNHQVDSTTTPRLAPSVIDRRVDATVSTSAGWPERNGFEVRLNALEMQLATRPRELIVGGMRSSGQLCQRQGRNRNLGGETGWIDRSKVNRDRRIKKAAIFSQPSSEA
jgi:hypothetical protein